MKLGRVIRYLNPIAHLGEKDYSFALPLLVSLLAGFISDVADLLVFKNESDFGAFVIVLFTILIIYFSFREGLKGGLTVVAVTVGYYIYIVHSRDYQGERYVSSLKTVAALGILYLILGSVIGWLKQTIDNLIEREANEKIRLQAIVHQLPIGMIVTDSKGKIEIVNRKAHTFLGKRIPAGLILSKTLPPNTSKSNPIEFTLRELWRSLTSGKSIRNNDLTIQSHDKKSTHLQISFSTIHNREGKTIAAVSTLNDITQQKELEQKKENFISMASHELKTPLTTIKLYIDSLIMVADKKKDQPSLKALNSVKDQTDRLQRLVNDLLDVSRLQSGKMPLFRENFRLNSLIKETISELQPLALDKKIVFSTHEEATVYADRFRISQVITNLLTNAMKFSSPGKLIRVQIRKSGASVQVTVEDHGVGIEKSEQKKIFDRLYQVVSENSRPSSGFGLGLYISKEIISRHHGKIWVESEKGKGATFHFTLPLARARQTRSA